MHLFRIAPIALGLLFALSCASSPPPICAPGAAWDSGRDQAAAGHAYRYELGSVCAGGATEAKFREGYTAGVQLYCVPQTAYGHGHSTAKSGQAAVYDANRYGICTSQDGFQQAYSQGHVAGVAELCVPTAGAKHGYDMGLAGRQSQFDPRAYSLCSPGQVAAMTAEYTKAHQTGVASFCSQASAQARAQGTDAGRRGSSENFDETPYQLCPLANIRSSFQAGKVAGLQEFCSPNAVAQIGQQQGQSGAASSFDGSRYGACSSSQQSSLRQAYQQGHSQGLAVFCRGIEDSAVAASLTLGRQGRENVSLANFGSCPRQVATAAQRSALQAYQEGLNEFCRADNAESMWSGSAQEGDPLRPYRLCSPGQVASIQNRYNRVVQARLASFCSEGRLRSAAAELAQDGGNFRLPRVFGVCLQSYPDTARLFAQLVEIEREAVITRQCSYEAGEAQGRQDALENRRKQTQMPGFCDRSSFSVYLSGYLDGWKGNLCSEDVAYNAGLDDGTAGNRSNYQAPRDCRDQRRNLSNRYNAGYQEGKRRNQPVVDHGHGHGGRPERPGRASNWSSDPGVIAACGNGFTGTANEQACLDLMTRVSYNPMAMMAACDAAMEGDSSELACIRMSVAARIDPTRSIESCDVVMTGDPAELACVEVVMAARLPLERPMAACDDAMTGDQNELNCIKAIAGARYDTTSSIAACDMAMTGDDFELQCIQAISRARGDSTEVIQACDNSMTGDDSELACIKRAVR
tara:strand:+ start:6164 stop:8404 length:2241 start_codon:yes stop_codon:yes gene_type:complete